jgi:DNA-binding response OmpR family regulator
MDAFAGASILLVEDDDDIRDLMATLLRLAGYEPTVCGSAEAGLEQLREQKFDLVLTDYALPNRTGGWLLRQAKAEGLLDATPALVVTAHPSPHGLDDFEVIPKPFDLDDLVKRVTLRLSGNAPGPGRGRRTAGSSRPGDDKEGDCPDPIDLILFVSEPSPQSSAAVAHVRRVLSGFRSSRVRLTVCDLTANPRAVPRPLTRSSSSARTFIVGHSTSRDLIVEMLLDCEELT